MRREQRDSTLHSIALKLSKLSTAICLHLKLFLKITATPPPFDFLGQLKRPQFVGRSSEIGLK